MEIPEKFLEGIPISKVIEQRAQELRALGPEPGLPAPEHRGAVFYVGQEVLVFDAATGMGEPAGNFVISKIEPGRVVLRGVPRKR